MLSINPYLHSCWSKPDWAIECIGILPRQQGETLKHAVILVFHWMPHSSNSPYQAINLESDATGCQGILDGLTETPYGESRGPATEGYVTGIQHDSFRPIVSGQEFEVSLDTLEDAEKMRQMVNIQWACVRIAAMSGATGPDDFADDFSEFDFEREEFERRVDVGLFSESSDSDEDVQEEIQESSPSGESID